MIEYSALVAAVGRHLAIEDTGEIKAGIEAVLGAVDQVLDADARGRLSAELPGSLRSPISNASHTRTLDTTTFVGVVASRGSYTTERARYWTQAVLASIAECDPGVAELIRPALPDATLLDPIGQGPAPVHTGIPTNLSPEMLTLDEIHRAVGSMPGWTGDEKRLVRTVEIPPERVSPLSEAVHRIESELNHHARLSHESADGGRTALTFTVWTHSLDRVTELDVQLAQRIDEAIRTVA